jgi:hypothetical protein
MKKLLLVAAIALVAFPQRAHALSGEAILDLIEIPLAVALVSEMTDVPATELASLVALLNEADVPPRQFIEVVRYAPAALVVDLGDRPSLIDFVRTEQQRGLVGPTLATSIERELVYYGFNESDDVVFVRPSEPNFIPAVVTTQVKTKKPHPHGGPPGQLKKMTGEQSAARIAHGDRDIAVVTTGGGDRTVKVKIDRDDSPGSSGKVKEKGPKHDGGKGKGTSGKGKGKDR